MSHFLTTCLQFSLPQAIESSITNLLIGIFGLRGPTMRWVHNGQVCAYLIQTIQNKLLQQGVSTASWKISKQIGHSHLSSERLLAEKLLNLLFFCRAFLDSEDEGCFLGDF